MRENLADQREALTEDVDDGSGGGSGGEPDPEQHRYVWHPGHCFEVCVDEHVTDWSGGDGGRPLRAHFLLDKP